MKKRFLPKKHHLILLAKLSFIAVALWWVFREVEAAQVDSLMKQSSPWMLLAAVVSYALAQVISGFRMRYYFGRGGVALNRKFSVALYFVASLYNLLMPGGIGGDGYKVYLIKRLNGMSYGKGVRIALSERASGLFILMLMALGLLHYTDLPLILEHGHFILYMLMVMLPLSYWVSIRFILQEKVTTALGASVYSLFIQGLNIACILFLLHGFGVWEYDALLIVHYVLLFLIAAVGSVLPISIGGVGLRELTFFYGAMWLGTDAEVGVALALMFFLVTLVVSMLGLVLMHKLLQWYENESI